jgi:hypothetical protein
MKKLFFLSVLTAVLVTFGASRAMAYDYYHDDKHWYDKNNKPHKLIVHNHHHGYWDTNSGTKVFINLD